MEYYILNCPHCGLVIQVFKHELNCKIFRHGIYKKTLKQVDPHLPKEECDSLYEKGLIYGCGKPFEIVIVNDEPEIRSCDYV